MSSYESVLVHLTSGFLSQTSIPTEYLKIPEIMAAINQYKWHITASNYDWTDVVKIVNYSS
jgi:hypothetical protein